MLTRCQGHFFVLRSQPELMPEAVVLKSKWHTVSFSSAEAKRLMDRSARSVSNQSQCSACQTECVTHPSHPPLTSAMVDS